MAATIALLPSMTHTINVGEAYTVMIDDHPIFLVTCEHQGTHFARLLNQARESGQHTAMRILTQDLGFCEGRAKAIFMMLHGSGEVGRYGPN